MAPRNLEGVKRPRFSGRLSCGLQRLRDGKRCQSGGLNELPSSGFHDGRRLREGLLAIQRTENLQARENRSLASIQYIIPGGKPRVGLK